MRTWRHSGIALASWLVMWGCATGSSDATLSGIGGTHAGGGDSGIDASAGSAGAGGKSGAGGLAGSAGKGGSSGSAGEGGSSGSAGTGGNAGNGGASGSSGSAGAGGSPPSCAGALVGGFCWYYAASASQHCGTVCQNHGGYNLATRDFAGSSGTDQNCMDVLDAIGAPGGTVSTLGGSGYGVGCFYSVMLSDRYRVADTATSQNATYSVVEARRACACNQ